MTGDDLRDAAKDTAASVEDGAARLVGGARDAATKVSESAGAAYERAKAGVSDLHGQMPDSASEAIEAGRRTYAQGRDSIGRQVARQPVEALLLAGAIGYLVGWAANRG